MHKRLTTKFYRVRVYVGPVHVPHYAEQARRNGLSDVFEGTEHVLGTASAPALDTETDKLAFRNRVAELVYGASMTTGWRDVEILRTL